MSFKKEEAAEELAESAIPIWVVCKNCRQCIPNRYRLLIVEKILSGNMNVNF